MVRSIPSLLALLLFVPAARAQSPTMHHWPLNEADGPTAWDHVGNAHGTLAGGATWDPAGGQFAGAARFDGVSGRVQTGPCDLINGGGGISISLWAKPDFVTGMERTLIAKATAPDGVVWSLSIANGSALRFRLLAAGQLVELSSTPALITSGTWYFIVGTYDGTTMRLYVNGSLIAATAAAGTIGLHPDVPVAMGALHNGQQPFSGWLDDVRVHDRGLDDQEVLDLLFENVSVGLPDTNGPPSAWADAEMLDAHGRVVGHLAMAEGSPRVDGPPGAAGGVYLVRSTGPQGALTRQVFVP
ncbi:MAG: LamG domain-containing protein [Flavobacteriales bacterium]|jgi:hypothetical protein|nr:LamG domain-containing protein [Flavobacteriales bacterium]